MTTDEKTKKPYSLVVLALLIVYACIEPVLDNLSIIAGYRILQIPYSVGFRFFPVAVIVAFIAYAIKRGFKLDFGVIAPIALVYFCYFLATAASPSKELSVWCGTVLHVMALYIFIMPVCAKKEILYRFVSALSWVYIILALFNLAFYIFPQLYDYVLGYRWESFISKYDNQSPFALFMGLLFALLDGYFNGHDIKKYAYVILMFANLYLAWCAAGIVAAAAFVVYLIPPFRKTFEKGNFLITTIIMFAMFAFFVWYWERVMDIPFISRFIIGALKKSPTFTGRTDVWAGVRELVAQRPFLGYGLHNDPRTLFFEPNWNADYVYAHNAYLQTLYEGGLITLSAVFIVFVCTWEKTRKCENRHLMGIFNIVFVMFMIMFQMDQIFISPWWSGCWCGVFFICNFAVMVSKNEY